MQKSVRVRRERPSALSWAVALAVTMLAVWLITLKPEADSAAKEAAARRERVTQELTLEGLTMYFADMGVYQSASDARIAAASLCLRGAAGVVWPDTSGYHVLGAGYALEADARRIAAQLETQDGLSAQVLVRSAEPLSLRITASEEDILAISAADRALRTCLSRLSTLALQVDRGEVGDASARTLAALAQSELNAAGDALSAVPGADREPLCAGLLALIGRLSAQLQSVSQSDASGAALSGALRCCHVDGAVQLIQWLDALSR